MRNNRGRFDLFAEYQHTYICKKGDLCREENAGFADLCSNDVEKLCIILRKKLRMCCELFCGIKLKNRFYVLILWIKTVLHRTVEKFYISFYTPSYIYKFPFLHNFHIAYYYNYYFY